MQAAHQIKETQIMSQRSIWTEAIVFYISFSFSFPALRYILGIDVKTNYWVIKKTDYKTTEITSTSSTVCANFYH